MLLTCSYVLSFFVHIKKCCYNVIRLRIYCAYFMLCLVHIKKYSFHVLHELALHLRICFVMCYAYKEMLF